MNLSLKASLIPKLYFNKEWFSSRLLEKAHPMFEKKLFPFPSSTLTIFCNERYFL